MCTSSCAFFFESGSSSLWLILNKFLSTTLTRRVVKLPSYLSSTRQLLRRRTTKVPSFSILVALLQVVSHYYNSSAHTWQLSSVPNTTSVVPPLRLSNCLAHSLFTAPSTCLQSYIRAYFENGTLPEESIICEVDATLFPSALNNGTFTEPHTMNVDTELFPAAP